MNKIRILSYFLEFLPKFLSKYVIPPFLTFAVNYIFKLYNLYDYIWKDLRLA